MSEHSTGCPRCAGDAGFAEALVAQLCPSCQLDLEPAEQQCTKLIAALAVPDLATQVGRPTWVRWPVGFVNPAEQPPPPAPFRRLRLEVVALPLASEAATIAQEIAVATARAIAPDRAEADPMAGALNLIDVADASGGALGVYAVTEWRVSLANWPGLVAVRQWALGLGHRPIAWVGDRRRVQKAGTERLQTLERALTDLTWLGPRAGGRGGEGDIDRRRAVLGQYDELVTKHPTITGKQAAKRLSVSRSTLSRYLNERRGQNETE